MKITTSFSQDLDIPYNLESKVKKFKEEVNNLCKKYDLSLKAIGGEEVYGSNYYFQKLSINILDEYNEANNI